MDGNGKATSFTYAAANHLTAITYPDQLATRYAYDAVGNRTQLVDALGTTTLTYDPARPSDEPHHPDAKEAKYAYDVLNRLTAVSDCQGGTDTLHL